ncbi:MAG: hypothetical protein ACAI44_37330, partial [Candidatus Sericytochromatia bacterium]
QVTQERADFEKQADAQIAESKRNLAEKRQQYLGELKTEIGQLQTDLAGDGAAGAMMAGQVSLQQLAQQQEQELRQAKVDFKSGEIEDEEKLQEILSTIKKKYVLLNLKNERDTLKAARTAQYEEEAKAEQKKLDLIDAQNRKLQDQIDLKNELLQQAQEQFDRDDLGQFASLVNAVDYQAELRAGLEDTHNPEGVETNTYSLQAHREAMTEHLDLRRMENENKYGLEEYDSANPAKNKAAYLKQRMEIDAIQARFAKEELTRTDLTNRERDELRSQQNQAYQDYKQAYLESLKNATEQEIQESQRKLDANQKAAKEIQSKIADLKASETADLEAIDARVLETLDTHTDLLEGIDKFKNAAKASLKELIKVYEDLQTAALDAAEAMIGGNASSSNPKPKRNTGQSATEMADQGYYVTDGDYWYATTSDMDTAKRTKSKSSGGSSSSWKPGMQGGGFNDYPICQDSCRTD